MRSWMPGSRRFWTSCTRPLAGDAGGKPDFNSLSAAALSADSTQKDPLTLGIGAGERYNQLASKAGWTRAIRNTADGHRS